MKIKLIAALILSIGLLSSNVFAAAEAEKELLLKTAQDPETLAALKELKAAAKLIGSENGISDVSSLKADVVDYYQNQFGKEYE